MSNYTPTTATIRAEYAGRVEAWEMTYAEQEAARAEEVVEFDRCLMAHDAEVRAQALNEAADELDLPGSTATGYYASEQDSGYRDAERDAKQWLRARAEQTKEDR